jgi:hypothetical protein
MDFESWKIEVGGGEGNSFEIFGAIYTTMQHNILDDWDLITASSSFHWQ